MLLPSSIAVLDEAVPSTCHWNAVVVMTVANIIVLLAGGHCCSCGQRATQLGWIVSNASQQRN